MHHSWMDVMPAAGTVLDFISNIRDVEPSFMVHPCFSEFMFGELSSRAYIATWPDENGRL